MKNIFFIFVLLLFSTSLFADEIYLVDNSMLKVTVTNVTGETVEYSTSENVRGRTQRDQIEKIVYSSGKKIEFYDKIYMKDGSILKGRVIKKSAEYIEYNPEGEIPYDKVETSGIMKVSYEKGSVENYGNTDSDLIYFKDGQVIKASGIIINQKDVEFYDENNIKQFYGHNLINKIVFKDGKTVYPDEMNQVSKKNDLTDTTEEAGKSVNSFVEFEWGWNGYAGAGARFDYLLFNNISINGAAGWCLWGYGYRFSGALRYYLEYPYGLAFSLGAAYNVGGPLETEMETKDDYSENTYKEKVEFDCKPVICINASILYSIQVNGRDKIYIETGYSYALRKEKYTYKTESGRELSNESEDIMDIIAPGGFLISAGYAIAF